MHIFHSFSKWANTEYGQERSCSSCGITEKRHFHKWNKWEDSEFQVKWSNGLYSQGKAQQRECATCGKKEREIISNGYHRIYS